MGRSSSIYSFFLCSRRLSIARRRFSNISIWFYILIVVVGWAFTVMVSDIDSCLTDKVRMSHRKFEHPRHGSLGFSQESFSSQGIVYITVEAIPVGKGMQAFVLRVARDKSMFYRVDVIGSQDTLLDLTGTHYFYNCYIQGSIDFIFDNARSFYEESVLHSTAIRSGAIAASHRNSEAENTGFPFVRCTVSGSGTVYMGRAWVDTQKSSTPVASLKAL